MTHLSHSPVRAKGGELCYWCGQVLLPTGTQLNDGHAHPLAGTRDHLVPRFLGGTDHHNNLVLACYTCNSMRGHMTVYAWRKRLKYLQSIGKIQHGKNRL